MPVALALAALPIATLPIVTLPLASARAQDAAAGQRVFAQCRVCHIADPSPRNGAVGPNLYGVVGRRAGTRENFRYSANMRQLGEGGLVWNEETLRPYLANPKAIAPQGIMSFPGLRNDQQITDVIAYLKSLPEAAPAGGAPAAPATPAAPTQGG